MKSSSQGRSCAISHDQELELAGHLKILEKWGFGRTRKELLHIVSEFVEVSKLKTPFKNNVPGEDKFLSFKKRHRLSFPENTRVIGKSSN